MDSAIYAGRWAAVRLTDGSQHRGFVHTVDPECGNVLILQQMNDPVSVVPTVLFSSSIDCIVTEDEGKCDLRVVKLERHATHASGSSTNESYDDSLCELRRAALRSLLILQRAPFEEQSDGKIVILGCLFVDPPYTVHSCRCENEIVLDRFLEMLKRSPLPESNELPRRPSG